MHNYYFGSAYHLGWLWLFFLQGQSLQYPLHIYFSEKGKRSLGTPDYLLRTAFIWNSWLFLFSDNMTHWIFQLSGLLHCVFILLVIPRSLWPAKIFLTVALSFPNILIPLTPRSKFRALSGRRVSNLVKSWHDNGMVVGIDWVWQYRNVRLLSSPYEKCIDGISFGIPSSPPSHMPPLHEGKNNSPGRLYKGPEGRVLKCGWTPARVRRVTRDGREFHRSGVSAVEILLYHKLLRTNPIGGPVEEGFWNASMHELVLVCLTYENWWYWFKRES